MDNGLALDPEFLIQPVDDGDPFSPERPKTSGLFDDILVIHLPHLALVSLEDFQKVIALRPPRQRTAGTNTKGLHPLSGKWKCPRCGRFNLKIGGKRKWMRCAGAWAAGLGRDEMPCDARPINLEAAEALMFRALETFSPGREANFASVARERYTEILDGAKAERRQAKEKEDRLRSEIRLLAKELARAQDNRYLRAALQEDADGLAAELDAVQAELQDRYAEVDAPDPKDSLLELGNMIDMIKTRTPFGFAVNAEALQFRNRLNDVVLAVTMVEKGDDHYDVEFVFNASAAVEQPGNATEIVRFFDVDLGTGRFQNRRAFGTIARNWEEGKYAISDRAWKKRPSFPHAERLAGDNVRWLVDTMIMTAETGLGTHTVVKLAGDRMAKWMVQKYRGSEECTLMREWLQEVRARKHAYAGMVPRNATVMTLRQRMEKVDHPLLRLGRFERSSTSAPLTDAEFETLLARLPEFAGKYAAIMRAHVDELIEMLRFDHYATRSNGALFTNWFKYQVKRGTFLKLVNVFLDLEGEATVASLPELPNGGHRKKGG